MQQWTKQTNVGNTSKFGENTTWDLSPPYPLILQPVAKTCKIRSFYFKEMEREARVVENWRKKTVDDDGQNAKG